MGTKLPVFADKPSKAESIVIFEQIELKQPCEIVEIGGRLPRSSNFHLSSGDPRDSKCHIRRQLSTLKYYNLLGISDERNDFTYRQIAIEGCCHG